MFQGSLFFCLFMCLLSATCGTTVQAFEEGLIVDSGYFRQMQTPNRPKTFKEDEGSVHVFLKNVGSTSVRIQEGFINAMPLSNQEEFLWYRISPNPILPMETGECVVRLRKSVANLPSTASANLRLITAEGKELATAIPLINHQLHFTLIGFSDTLGSVFLYVSNSGQRKLSFHKVFLSTKDVTRNCRIPERQIGQNDKRLIVINLAEPLVRGRYISVKVTTKEGVIAQSRVRVFSNFSLGGLDRKSNLELFMDGEELDWTKDEKKTQGLFHHLLDCPMHTGNDHSMDAVLSNARIILAKMGETGESSFLLPRYIHVCRADIYNGCANFGQIADFIRINPSVALLPSLPNYLPEDTDYTPVRYLSAFAKKACEPKPFHTTTDIAATSPNDVNLNSIPERERLLVYSAVSSGAKGIFYRIWGDSLKDRPELKQEIKKINGELQVLKRYLKFGEPMSLAACTHSDVEPTTILAGDKAIVLILIDRNPIESEKTEDGIQEPFSPKLDFEVTVHTPRWMQIKDVYEVGEDFGRPKYRKRGNRIVIKVNRLDFTKQIVLTTRADDYDHDQDQDGISDIDEVLVHNTHPAIPNLHPTSQTATD